VTGRAVLKSPVTRAVLSKVKSLAMTVRSPAVDPALKDLVGNQTRRR